MIKELLFGPDCKHKYTKIGGCYDPTVDEDVELLRCVKCGEKALYGDEYVEVPAKQRHY